ncbi:unnamed protein product, partial [Mesorhabditis spiculigera]
MSGPVASMRIQRTTIWTTNIVVSKDIELSIIYKWHPQPSIHLKWQNKATSETRKFIYKNADLKGWLKLLERLRPASFAITVAAGLSKDNIAQVRTIRSRLNGAPNMWGSDCDVNDSSKVRYLEWVESLADLPSIGLRVFISRRGEIETVFNIFEAILQLLIQKLPPQGNRPRTFIMYFQLCNEYRHDTCQQWADDRIFSARLKETMASVDLPEGATLFENFSPPPKMEQRIFVLAQGEWSAAFRYDNSPIPDFLHWAEKLVGLPVLGLVSYIHHRSQIVPLLDVLKELLAFFLYKHPPQAEQTRIFLMVVDLALVYELSQQVQEALHRQFSKTLEEIVESVRLPDGTMLFDNYSAPPMMHRRSYVLTQGFDGNPEELKPTNGL